ncbi:unnamed protein product, partial [Amoebophrya sp. A25]
GTFSALFGDDYTGDLANVDTGSADAGLGSLKEEWMRLRVKQLLREQKAKGDYQVGRRRGRRSSSNKNRDRRGNRRTPSRSRSPKEHQRFPRSGSKEKK